MTKPDTWYVAFEPADSSGEDAAARKTRNFKSEIDAKLFAMQILAKGWRVSAGTLQAEPETMITPANILQWTAPPQHQR